MGQVVGGMGCAKEEYERHIYYLDYLEGGQRVKGAGFLKLERRNEKCSISLQVGGLYRKDSFIRGFFLLYRPAEPEADGGWLASELCRIRISEGGAKVYFDGLDVHDMDGKGLSLEQVTGIRIPISESKEICCSWAGEKKYMARKEEVPKQEAVQSEVAEREKGRRVALQEDKWHQLWDIYPHICPFEDDREYLTLGLQDFVLLPERFYRLIGNSFLLHGYYNYGHIVLIRAFNRGRVQYYLGVPGNYYYEEKRAAVLFGFGHFECKGHSAEDGEQGYYLMPIEL